MSGKPWIIDLFCGAGGATKGYQDAGFRVLGVDKHPQPNYCGEEFVQADALHFLESQGHELSPASFAAGEPVSFVGAHASPPCQAYSVAAPRNNQHPRLIDPIRLRLIQSGLPYVIENVPGAPLMSPVQLCGSGFGKGLQRHRLFETNFPVMGVACAHGQMPARFDVYEHGRWYKSPFVKVYGSGGGKAKEHWAEEMEIDWMSYDEMAEAIPPYYTEWVGSYLMSHLEARKKLAA